MYVHIEYINALEGGSGQTSMDMEELPVWLATKPGTLIKAIRPDNLIQSEAVRDLHKRAIRALANSL